MNLFVLLLFKISDSKEGS